MCKIFEVFLFISLVLYFDLIFNLIIDFVFELCKLKCYFVNFILMLLILLILIVLVLYVV